MKRIIRRLLRYINLGLAILLVLSFMSPHISPAKLWFPSFLGLAYPYILILNIFFLVFWILMKKREFIISFLVILLGWNTLITYVGIHPGAVFKKGYFNNLSRDDRVSDNQLKVMSFNVRAFDQYHWADKPTAQQDILEMFRSEDPDILCIQEYYTSDRGRPSQEEIFSALDRTPYRHLEYRSTRRGTKYGIGVFSHYPIVGSGRLDLQSKSRICTWTDIMVFDDTLRIYNMHLQSTRLSSRKYNLIDDPKLRYDDEQMEEIRDISSRLKSAFIKRAGQADIIGDHIAESPHPVIVCGDFNDTPISYTYHRISENLSDAFSKSSWGIGRTYNGKFPSFRIDYILHSPELETTHFSRRKIRLSDHFPIIGYMKIH